MENQDHVNEEREMVEEEVLFEGRVEEGVAITISDSDAYYEESSSTTSTSEFFLSDGEGLVDEFSEPELVAGPSRPDTSKPVGVVAPERRARITGRAESPAGASVGGSVRSPSPPRAGNEAYRDVYIRDDLDLLEAWVTSTRVLRGTEGFVVPPAPVFHQFDPFLSLDIGPRYEEVLLRRRYVCSGSLRILRDIPV